MENQKKVLVIGAGLAGVTVAYHLIEKGCSVTLIDNDENHSSVVAAGLITPLVFRRMNKSWRVDEFIDYLIPFYNKFSYTNEQVLKPVPLRRMFSSEQERGYWINKQTQDDYQRYMEPLTEEDDQFDGAINTFGSGRVKNCFSVNAALFFPAIKSFISKKGKIVHSHFNHNDLNQMEYMGVNYDDVVFCEGYLNKNNPWFGDLPIGQTKGEVLTIRAESIPSEYSLNRKCFMLPLGNHTFRVGSTYNWNNPDPTPTEEGKAEILEKLSYITKEQVEILDHTAGVRPTTMDRRPVIGTHNKYRHLHIFNGLGTKGYMSAPLLSREFAEYLCESKPMVVEVTSDRYLNK